MCGQVSKSAHCKRIRIQVSYFKSLQICFLHIRKIVTELALRKRGSLHKKHIKPKIEEIEKQLSKAVKQYINTQPCNKQKECKPMR
jgi:hypothetical protein